MHCAYLWGLDLQAAYEQLDNYNEVAPLTFAGLHHTIASNLSCALEDHACLAAREMFGDDRDWREIHPADLAAEVGDIIEADIEHLADLCSEISAQHNLGDGSPVVLEPVSKTTCLITWVDNLALITEADGWDSERWHSPTSLIICQYGLLNHLYQTREFELAMQVFDLIVSSACTSTYYLQKGLRSEQARRSAAVAHKAVRQQKNNALADWEAEGHNFSSMRAFARECYKRYEVTDFMTVYNWLREHRKRKT